VSSAPAALMHVPRLHVGFWLGTHRPHVRLWLVLLVLTVTLVALVSWLLVGLSLPARRLLGRIACIGCRGIAGPQRGSPPTS
jgi:hypothetical protein